MNKKVTRVISIVLIAIIVLICFEITVRFIVQKVEEIKYNNEIEKQQEAYKQTDRYETEVYLTELINTAIDYMKSGDYETLYQHINPLYKTYKNYVSLDEFKIDLLQYIKEVPIEATLSSFQKNGNNYVCNVLLIRDKETISRNAFVTSNVDDDFFIVFDNVYSIKEMSDLCTNLEVDELKYKLAYIIEYSEISIYSIEITNDGDSVVTASLEGSNLIKSDRESYTTQEGSDLTFTVSPGETVKCNLLIEVSRQNPYIDEEIELVINYENGEVSRGSIMFY